MLLVMTYLSTSLMCTQHDVNSADLPRCQNHFGRLASLLLCAVSSTYLAIGLSVAHQGLTLLAMI